MPPEAKQRIHQLNFINFYLAYKQGEQPDVNISLAAFQQGIAPGGQQRDIFQGNAAKSAKSGFRYLQFGMVFFVEGGALLFQ